MKRVNRMKEKLLDDNGLRSEKSGSRDSIATINPATANSYQTTSRPMEEARSVESRGVDAGKSHNDRKEFEEQSIAYLDTLYRNALELAKNPSDAEDLVQDTYVKALCFYETFQPGTNLKAWLLRINLITSFIDIAAPPSSAI